MKSHMKLVVCCETANCPTIATHEGVIAGYDRLEVWLRRLVSAHGWELTSHLLWEAAAFCPDCARRRLEMIRKIASTPVPNSTTFIPKSEPGSVNMFVDEDVYKYVVGVDVADASPERIEQERKKIASRVILQEHDRIKKLNADRAAQNNCPVMWMKNEVSDAIRDGKLS